MNGIDDLKQHADILLAIYDVIGSEAISIALLEVTSAQSPSDAALKFDVTLTKSPPSITLKWDLVRITGYTFTNTYFYVYRADPRSLGTFGAPIKTIPIINGTNTYSFTDTNITVGVAYEYNVVINVFPRQAIEGFAVAGIELPLVENRGNVLLVIEQQAASNMTAELNQLKMDLIGDGWTVSSITVAKNSTASQVKSKIVSALGGKNATIFVFGSVPVPYSGELHPDAHSNHLGAWPADVYYTSLIESAWVDTTVNDNSSVDSRNWNWPGDGKFDLTALSAFNGNAASVSTLEIGRVDLSRFSGQDEMALLRKYLKKDHGYRQRDPEYTFAQRAVINDGFGWFSNAEAFAVAGWRTFSSVVGKDNIVSGNLFTTLGNTSAIWAFGCGAGSFQGAYSVGSYTDFLTKPMRAAFTMLFGSFFIDWDSSSNFLRSPLAGSHALTSIASGRPYAFFHHMGAGFHTGFSARQTQANTFKYMNYNYYQNYVYQNLMGDPTLRMYMVDPPKNVTLKSGTTTGVSLTWKASSDVILGYHVYRATASVTGPYTRLTTQLVTTNSYVDTGASSGTNYYMVRAVQLTRTPTASFFNPSQAAFFQTNYVPTPQSPLSPSPPSTSNVQNEPGVDSNNVSSANLLAISILSLIVAALGLFY